ncbi:MAG: ATP-dependent helicase [Candidatus Parcubacteria bacterium]|jgi:ATP-dependent exoDNAse (exonuclease V) alpha subunit|nr:ATP-dependent helicase [Candidatus Parcubacteria bacterium]
MLQSEALQILRTGVNVFLTGEPGSGKTHTVNAYVQWLRARGIEPAITASTGIAATHIHGMTIHSWSGIGIRDSLSEAELDAIASKEHVARRIQKTNILIIDEVSMLSANVLTMVDQVCKEVRRKPELSFGGMQVVLVGDFFQLPPIVRGHGASSAPFAFESSAWENLHPIICYLSEQHRQEDPKFLSILSAIRTQEADHTTASAILARETEELTSEEHDDIPRLFTHNADVDKLNDERLTKLPGRAVSYGMRGEGSPVLVEALKRGCLSPETLILKEGAVVMGTKNLPLIGLWNGTLGIVTGFERGTNYPQIETRDGRTLTIAPAEWAVEEGGRVRAKVTQIPLRLAWAITVHKSQGMSLDAAVVDLSRAFEYGQGYVALSRVRTFEGLFILGWSENALLVHPEVARRDAEFRELSSEAAVGFGELEESGERSELEKNFIRTCGGTLTSSTDADGKPVRKPKATTYDKTLELLTDGMTLREVALERSLTYGTVCDHVEKLVRAGRLDPSVLDESVPDALRKELPDIFAAFKERGAKHLGPVYESLKGKYAYDDLRIARVLYGLDCGAASSKR